MHEHRLNIVFNTIICALTVIMLFFAYKNIENRLFTDINDKAMFDELWISGSSEASFDKFKSEYCLPQSIIYKAHGQEPYALYMNNTAISAIYNAMSDNITSVLGSESICEKISDDVHSLESRLKSEQSYLIFDFDNRLPCSCIFALSSGLTNVKREMCASGEKIYLSKLIYVIDNSQNYKCIAIDTDKAAYSFVRADGELYKLSDNTLQTLQVNSGKFRPVKYAEDINADISKYSPMPFDVIFEGKNHALLSEIGDVSKLSLDTEEGRIVFTNKFGLNPEKLKHHIGYDNSHIFVGTLERLDVSADGMIYFSSPDDPIQFKNILGYSPLRNVAYSEFDIIKAADIFINRFTNEYPNLFGGECIIKLSGCTRDNSGQLLLDYSYYHEGIKLNVPNAFSFKFDSKGITNLQINYHGYSSTETTTTLPLASDIVKRIENAYIGDKFNRIEQLYSKNSNNQYAIMYSVH